MKLLFLLFLSVFLAEIATDIYVPSLPALIEKFSTDVVNVQLTMSFHLLGFVIGQFIYGILSDRIGRIQALCLGTVLFFISSFGCGASLSIEILILFRFLQGLGASACPVIALAMIKDRSSDSADNIRLISLLTMIISLSPIVGPVLGVVIQEYVGWRANFFLIGFAAALLLFFYLVQFSRLREAVQRQTVLFGNFPRSYFRLYFFKYLLINALLVSCVWVFVTEAPFILITHFKLTSADFVVLQSFTVVSYMIGGWAANRMVGKWQPDVLLNRGLFVIGFSACMFFFGSVFVILNHVFFIISFSIFEFGLGMARPSLIDKMMSFGSGHHGLAAAFIGASEMLLSAAFIFLASLYRQNGTESLTSLLIFAALLCIGLQWLLKHPSSIPDKGIEKRI